MPNPSLIGCSIFIDDTHEKLIVVSRNQVAQRSCKGRNIFDNNLPSYGAIDFRISMRHEIPETPDVLPCHRRACILNSIRKVNCVLSNPIYRIHHGVVRKLTFKRVIIAKRFPCHCEVFDTLPDDVCIVDFRSMISMSRSAGSIKQHLILLYTIIESRAHLRRRGGHDIEPHAKAMLERHSYIIQVPKRDGIATQKPQVEIASIRLIATSVRSEQIRLFNVIVFQLF